MKKVNVLLSVVTEVEVPKEWDESTIQFHVEENFCIGNLINSLFTEVSEAEAQGKCSICSHSDLKVLGLRTTRQSHSH